MSDLKIIFVDDKPADKRALIEAMESEGIRRSNITVAQSLHDARRQVEATQFDIMILDLMLPERAEDDALPNGGVILLKDIAARPNRFKLPRYIIGLTAHEDLHASLAASFDKRLWPLLKYDPSSNDWISRIRSQVSHAIATEAAKASPDHETDVCIVAALAEPELASILRLDWNWVDPIRLDDSTLYHEGSIVTARGVYSVRAASTQRMGQVAAAVTASKLIQQFRPRLLVMPGICAGLESATAIGDVILAETVWHWQAGKLSGDGHLAANPHQIHVNDLVTSRFRHLAGQVELWQGMFDSFAGNKPNNIPKGLTGPVATSESVIASSTAWPAIRAQNRKAIGIEMEAYGLYAAGLWAAHPRPIASFALKAVCDFGDEGKDDSYQQYAAYTSAQATKAVTEAILAELSTS